MKSISPHPNIVLFRGITIPPNPLCLILEYCEEGSLVNLLKSEKEINNQQKINFALHIVKRNGKLIRLFYFNFFY